MDLASVEGLKKSDYYVTNASLHDAQRLVKQYHYAKGGSNTGVYIHGLYRRCDNALVGVAWWIPPTRLAAETVNRRDWQRVLALSRLVIVPDIPHNACSFLIARSIKLIWRDDKWLSLVTYADESEKHTGAIYRASNWKYVGFTKPYPKWVDSNGRMVARKAGPYTRTKADMLELGLTCQGHFRKHKFVLHHPLVEGTVNFFNQMKEQVQ